MAAGNWLLYDNAKEYIGDGTVDLDNDTFYMALCTNENAGIQVLTLDQYSDITTELAAANGYASYGSQIQDVVWQQVSAGTSTFSCSRTTWTASGGDIGARYAVIYSLSGASKLICSAVLDTSVVTATDGNTFTVIPHGSGIFALGLGNT